MTTTIYHHATVFTAEGPEKSPDQETPDALAVRDGLILAVGPSDAVRAVAGPGAEEVDLDGRFVAPGIIDAHTHLDSFGESLAKVQLRDCSSLKQILQALVAARAADPRASRVLGIGWLFDAVGAERPTAAMLDAVLPDVPVYLDANDLHSAWVNSAALAEMGIDDSTPDPVGGEIARDEFGRATGMLYETACTRYVWSFLASVVTPEDRIRSLDRAFTSYLGSGVTGATDMSMNDAQLSALRAIIDRDGRLPFPVSAHYLLEPSGSLEQDLAAVSHVAAVREDVAGSGEDGWLRISGVKFILDGVIDACTAPMRWPYADGTNADPIWGLEELLPVAEEADAEGLQLAMHAIGDRTSQIALDVVEHCAAVNGPPARRHRIEHLESVADETISRMAALGVTASMQPVHCDPAVLRNWKAVLGDSRAETGFPWQKLREAGVPMALGTDAPTAPHQPLSNLYIALTGGSAIDPSLPPYHPERVFTPEQALTALTAGSADASGIEGGRLRPGLPANFVVLDVDPFAPDPSALLKQSVVSTYVAGRCVHAATSVRS
ncbi:amidohydrolase [Rothia uropygioeca]|uniref:amidohydrolase n=1 Tax=Kocuria sp. 257 TaxID=2021970 RepID=UPI001EDFCB60|nr:amidohydrolase [Kocuria sp. 257]